MYFVKIIWRRVSFDGSVTETLNDGLMSRDMSRWKIGQGKQTNSIRLEILVVDESYAGLYTCDCQYTGSVEPARAERILRVVSQAKVLPFHSSYTTTVTEGDRMILRCQAAGIPTPVTYWTRTGGSSSIIRNYGISKPGETIEFTSVLPQDAGEYMCMAENRLGVDYWPVIVTVRHKPISRIYVSVPIIQNPCNVHLYCEVLANPASEMTEISWSVGTPPTTILVNSRMRLVYMNGGNTRFLVLNFNPILRSDLNKKYVCNAYNSLGTAVKEYILNESSIVTEGTFADLKCGGCSQRIDLANILYADINIDPNSSLVHHIRSFTPLLPNDAFQNIRSEPNINLAESLLRERMRCGTFNPSDIKFDPQTGTFLISVSGKLVQFTDHSWCASSAQPSECSLSVLASDDTVIQPIVCPFNTHLVAYVAENNIAVSNSLTSNFIHLTDITDPKVTAGTPAFVIQEEFGRYVGLWWCPKPNSEGEYCLIYEKTDSNGVGTVRLPNFASWSEEVEEHVYPKPGSKNATSDLVLVTFSVDKQTSEITNVKSHNLPSPLFKILSQYEYLVRCDWTSDGNYFWMILSDRLQTKMSLFLVSPRSFYEGEWTPFIHLRDEEDATYWVEVHDCLRFLKTNSETVHYIWMSRSTGYSHLYICHQNIPQNLSSSAALQHAELVSDCPLTSGAWDVLNNHIFVDRERNLVLFESFQEDPLFLNIYAVNYSLKEVKIHRLTSPRIWLRFLSFEYESDTDEDRLYYSILNYDESLGLCAIEASSPTLLPGKILFRLSVGDDGTPELKPVALLKCMHSVHSILPPSLQVPTGPRIMSYTFQDESDTVTFYGMLFTPPPSTKPPQGFPTLHLVYGGPGVQIVRGLCLKTLFLRIQIYCHYGYAVFMCDCRGSSNRGSHFAGLLKYNLGSIELPDHVMFLREAARQSGSIDLSRVAIHGSSYGGYLSLMAAAQYRDVYRAAIAVCPVVSWRHYDTAYTERYLGLPSENELDYRRADVLTYIEKFPDFAPYLMIAHGGKDENVHFAHTANLIQELNSRGKPYEFEFYPTSRHRIRDDDHLTASIIQFLDRTLRG
nr:Dipeptidyl peptidase 9 [Hymenolepis microstoma]